MPARDLYHDAVVTALVKEGWTITHDPLTVKFGRKDLYVDLGAERVLAADKGGRKIAVEIKSFVGASEAFDLEVSLGQFFLYRNLLRHSEPDRTLHLAVRESTFAAVFDIPDGRRLIAEEQMYLILFDELREDIVRWIP